MNSLSGARKLCTSIWSRGEINVSMSMTGTPPLIIFSTGAFSVSMLNGWMATKSHFWFAKSSIAVRCLASESSPSNQVTSTLNSLPQYSAACLPWAHQLTCRPIVEKAAFSGFSDRAAALPISAASAGETLRTPSNEALARPAVARNMSRRFARMSVIEVSLARLAAYGRGSNVTKFRARRAVETDCTGRIRPIFRELLALKPADDDYGPLRLAAGWGDDYGPLRL